MNRLLVNDPKESPATQHSSWDLVTALLIVYVAWLFVTPNNSPRLTFLSTIKFERILAGVLLVLVLLRGNLNNLFHPIALTQFLLFGIMVVSTSLSEHGDFSLARRWREEYWKAVVFFALLVAGLRSVGSLNRMVSWTVFIIFFYQMLSWMDFLRGGSYVYQQGMKRMIGTWSGGGLGAANAFGSLAVFSLPLIVGFYRSTGGRRGQRFAIAAFALSFMSVVYSGTRAALVVAAFYVLFEFRARLLRPKVLLTAT